MLAHGSRRRFGSIVVRLVALVLLTSAPALLAGCDKMPLVAPTGTVITLYANSNVLPVDGSIEITAVAIQGGTATTTTGGTTTGGTTGGTTTAPAVAATGTPVHNGTVITFTTTLGTIDPVEARTHNGTVTVRLSANGQSGVANVRAFSGGASSNELVLNVGAAAAKTVFLSASPSTLNSAGGSAVVSARVVDPNGSNLPGVPVTFTTDNGIVSPSTATTDQTGTATTTLTTTRTSKVTANVGNSVTADVTVTVNPRIGLTITPPSTQPTAGIASTFTIAVASTSNVQNVVMNWGDGTTSNLGAVTGSTTVSHTYQSDGNFTVTATANDATGETATVSTAVAVLPQQPPSVTVTSSNSSPHVNEIVQLTASVSGAASTVQNYHWDLGANANPSTADTTSPRLNVSWSTTGTKVITVTVTQASGPVGIGQTAVTVQP